jgi:hypothetical protein
VHDSSQPAVASAAAPLLVHAESGPRWRWVAAAGLSALPWLNPFSDGPAPTVQPWLASMACALLLWVLAGPALDAARLRLIGAATGLVLWAAVSQQTVRPELVFLAGGLALIVFAASLADDPEVSQGLQAGLLAAATASAAIGLLQYFGLAEGLAPWVSRSDIGEAYANLRQPNQYATLTWIGAAVLLWGTLRLRTAAAVALIVLLAVGSAASVSRTGVVQGLVLSLLAAWWSGAGRRRALLLCAVAAVAYFAAAWLLPVLLEGLGGALPERTLWGRLGEREGCGSRIVLWGNVLHLILLKPIFGWGWGELDYAHFMTLYEGPRFCDILDNAHNLPLHLAVELGLPAALLAVVAGVGWMLRQRPWNEAAPRRRLAWAILALVLLHSMLEYPLWYGPFQLAAGIAIGWLLPAAARRELTVRAVAAGVAGLLLAATAYAAWDYERVIQIYKAPEERRSAWRENTLEHARRSWLFSGPSRFAELTLSSVTRANAAAVQPMALEVLHYSPEPRVAERLIASTALLGQDREAALHLARFRAAFPVAYQAWVERQQQAPQGGARPPQ